MSITRRDMVKRLGLGGTAAGLGMLAGRGFADETDGDPAYAGFARNIRVVEPSMQDVPSARLEGGKVIQPARELPIFHTADVVVVGGGAAGFGAAVAASRAGAKVALIERYGSLGGLFTNGMVLIIIGTGVKENGEFKLVTRGVCEEFMRRLEAMGDGAITKLEPNIGQPTADPEAAKVLMDDMVQEAKVDVFFHAWGVDVIQNGQSVQGVVFESKQGRQAVLAKVVVDASGDGDVFFQAGESYTQISHALGFVHRLGNTDRIDKSKAPKDTRLNIGGREPLKSVRWVNSLGSKGNGLDIRDMTQAEMMHRKSAWNYTQRIRKTPGYEEVYLAQTTSQLGVRATRLLNGVVRIDKKGAVERTTYPDTVAVSGHDGLRLPEFQIPYGSLLPKSVDNVIVAGRCISCAPDLIDRVRLIPVCVVTGQAAGVAAALAAKGGVRPRDLPAADIQKVLREQGAYLG
ncbi:MAG TPA: FAD-dependent oxidoreductase [Kiritimatiellia bacterium]|nr:FAD-dependent oxidoreductase [Kiritimatiellia bacterium]